MNHRRTLGLAFLALTLLAASGRADDQPAQGCTGQEADVEAALACRLNPTDRAAYQEALQQAANDNSSADAMHAAREKVTEQYLAKLPPDQQKQFSSFVGQSKLQVSDGMQKALAEVTAAGSCPSGVYDKGQCVSTVDVANKPNNAKDATSQASATDPETAKGLATKEPPVGPYPSAAGDAKKPFKLSDNQKAGVVSGFWGALLFGMLMGPAGLILGGAVAAAAGYAMAKQGSDDSGGGGGGSKSSGGGHGGEHHDHDGPGSHIHVDTSKIHF